MVTLPQPLPPLASPETGPPTEETEEGTPTTRKVRSYNLCTKRNPAPGAEARETIASTALVSAGSAREAAIEARLGRPRLSIAQARAQGLTALTHDGQFKLYQVPR